MKVEYYMMPNGRMPAKEYIAALDKGLRSKTARSIKMLELFGNLLGEPDSKHLEDGIFELRTSMGGNAGRVLYFFVVGDCAVLTHGFVKKTQKTPRREIERAKQYREDYFKSIRECGCDG